MLSIHFFFLSITQATLVLVSTLPTSSSFFSPKFFFHFNLDEKARKVQKCFQLHRWGKLFKLPVIMRLLICQLDRGLSLSFLEPPPPPKTNKKPKAKPTDPCRNVAQLNKLHSSQNRIVYNIIFE